MSSKRTLVFLSILALLGTTTTVLFCQGQAGGLRGTVSDTTGAAVAGVPVKAVNVATGVATSTVSTNTGLYNITPLPAGVYRVEAEKSGFKKILQDNVTIPLAVVVGLDLTLQVGTVSETVEVTASATLVEKETSVVDTSVNPKSYLDLPVNAAGGRSVVTFTDLSPGAYGSNSYNYQANGAQMFTRGVRVDGLDVGNILAQAGDTDKVMTLPPDAVQELTYDTSTPSADLGNSMSGTIQYTVRSGSNQLHGSAYEFYVGNALNARNFLQSNISRFNQNEYGFTVGGPIYIPHVYNGKNRSFFFFNFNGFSQRSKPNNAFASVPTAQEHNGNFSDYVNGAGHPIPIYDPDTTTPLPGGGFTRQQFSCNGALNVICPERISAISAKIAAGIPSPTSNSLTNNFFQKTVSNSGFKNETFKIDEVLSGRQRFSFTFNRSVAPSVSCSNPCFDYTNTTSATVAAGIESAGSFKAKHQFDHLNYDLTISPTTLFHATLGLERYSQCQLQNSFGLGWDSLLGIGNVGNGPFPFVGFGSTYQSLGVSLTGDNECFYGTVPQSVESITAIRGRHTFKFGGENQWFSNEHTLPSTTGGFNFSQLETGLPGATSTTGNPFASFLLGDVDSANRHVQNIATDAEYWYTGLYVMDDIKWTQKLTVNLGLRYELFKPYIDKQNNLSIMNPTLSNPGCNGCLGALEFAGFGPGRIGSRSVAPPMTKLNFTPRLGIAYALRPTLVIRTGYAIMDEMPAVAGSGFNRWSDLGFVADQTFASTNTGVTPAFNWNNGFPPFAQPPSINPAFGINSIVDIFDSNASHPGYLEEWHFNIQESFRPNWLLDVGYVGSKGTDLMSGAININQTNSSYLNLGPLLTNSITNATVVADGFKPPYVGFTGSLSQALRPFPQYLYVGAGGNNLKNLQNGGAQIGDSTYNSLQVKLQHNVSQGLWLLTALTWEKWLTDAPMANGSGAGDITSNNGSFEGVSVRDEYHRSLERALGPVPPEYITAGFNYELPIGPGKRLASNSKGAVSVLLKGWQVNGILSYYAGLPAVVTVNNTLPIFNDINFPNILQGVPQILNHSVTTPTGAGKQLYLNPAAFQLPAAFTYGNGPQTLNVRSPASPNENISIMKRTNFERAVLELRFETFNTFNRHIFGGIDHNLNDTNFGAFTSVSGGRTAQVAGKVIF